MLKILKYYFYLCVCVCVCVCVCEVEGQIKRGIIFNVGRVKSPPPPPPQKNNNNKNETKNKKQNKEKIAKQNNITNCMITLASWLSGLSLAWRLDLNRVLFLLFVFVSIWVDKFGGTRETHAFQDIGANQESD